MQEGKLATKEISKISLLFKQLHNKILISMLIKLLVGAQITKI